MAYPRRTSKMRYRMWFLVAHRRLRISKTIVLNLALRNLLRVAKDHRRSQSVKRIGRNDSPILSPVAPPRQTPSNKPSVARQTRLCTPSWELIRSIVRLSAVELEGLSVRDVAGVLHLHWRACQRRLRKAHAAFEKKLARYLQPDGRQTP